MIEGKNIPELRFPGFTGEWEEKKLGEMGEVLSCKRIYERETSLYDEIPFYKISTFGGKADAFISRKLYENYRKKYNYPEKGDILISASGTIGKTVIYCGEEAYFQDSNIVWLNILKKDKLLNKFLYFYYDTIIWNKLEGGTIKRLYNKDLLELKVVFPSLAEQKKIGSFFYTLDQKLDLQKKRIEELKTYKKGMMQRIFSQEIRFKDENGQDYPDWEEKKLGDITEYSKAGGTPKTTISKYYKNGDIPFLSISDMTKQGKYIYDTVKRITICGMEQSSTWLVPKNSLIYSMYASIGFVSINKIELCTSQAMYNIILNCNYSVEYIYYYLTYVRKKEITRLTETGTQGNLNASLVKGIIILVPSLLEQEKIASFLSAIDKKIELEEERLESYEEFKKGLMQRMFV